MAEPALLNSGAVVLPNGEAVPGEQPEARLALSPFPLRAPSQLPSLPLGDNVASAAALTALQLMGSATQVLRRTGHFPVLAERAK